MCFKAPKPPKVVEDPNLKRQTENATQVERERRSADKEARLEEAMRAMNGGYGRRSLISGSKGGAGFMMGAARSLIGGV